MGKWGEVFKKCYEIDRVCYNLNIYILMIIYILKCKLLFIVFFLSIILVCYILFKCKYLWIWMGKNFLYLDNIIYKVNLILVFYRNYRRLVRFLYILYEEDDIKSIYWFFAIGG